MNEIVYEAVIISLGHFYMGVTILLGCGWIAGAIERRRENDA